jgi:hypothetical protein
MLSAIAIGGLHFVPNALFDIQDYGIKRNYYNFYTERDKTVLKQILKYNPL